MNKIDFISRMNYLGAKRIPFLFIIDFDFSKPVIIPLEEIDNSEILFNTPGKSNHDGHKSQLKEYSFKTHPVRFSDYKIAFNTVMNNLLAGNSYLLNLTFATKIETDLTLTDIFYHGNAKYKLCFKDEFVCFSPEIFVKIKHGKIYSYPMKGTIDANIDNALEIIMNDDKEFAEHNTIVDLIRNDLSMVSKQVKVTKFRYADYLKTNKKNLIQISSEISGNLADDYHEHLGDIISALLPAGSVTGAPKQKTIEIIKSAEDYDRNYYTGVFGIFDGQDLDSAVMIRFIEKSGDGYVFKSGGGITTMSNAESEYQELLDKVYVPIY